MCYIVARDSSKIGSFMFEPEHGEELVSYKRKLNNMINDNYDIEIITISSPEAYGEYHPYEIIKTQDEFTNKVKMLLKF